MTGESPSAIKTRFDLPSSRVAPAPAEQRGLARDMVRLMVATPDGIVHSRFRTLASHLQPGDVVVVNTSATRRAALDGSLAGRPVTLHLSTRLDGADWVVELRHPDQSGPMLDAMAGDVVELPRCRSTTLISPADGGEPPARLWRAQLSGVSPSYLHRHGRPIRYSYVSGDWPIESYQTMFARRAPWSAGGGGASAEMPSAARPFTRRVVRDLDRRGVTVASITLHAGVSSQESHEYPQPEYFAVPAETAERVNRAKLAGARVVAVGTTATRALETVADDDGLAHPAAGWTDHVVNAHAPARVVDGLVTGFHPPEASHLMLLEQVAGPDVVDLAYRTALDTGYLWHEFGDSCLFLPMR